MISVLMPVYNVEDFIEKTLESVAAQTLGDFEVIMVDDGSSDRSGEICDSFCLRDSRMRVIHTENRGVSAARNTALENVKGEYIFFMDSDDLILPETFEELLKALTENGADIALGNIYYTDGDANPIDRLNDVSPVRDAVISNLDYIGELCKPTANFFCTSTSKLFKAELFDSITYPVGRINEDEARIHEVVYGAEKIVTLKKRYYNYIKHPKSITGAYFTPKNLDRETAFLERIEFLRGHGLHSLADKTALTLIDSAIVSMTKLIDNSYWYGRTKKRVLGFIKEGYSQARRVKDMTPEQKKIMTLALVILRCGDFYEKYLSFKAKSSAMGAKDAVIDEAYNFIMKCFSLLPTRNAVVFESHPELTCNTYPVFEYLLGKGLNEKYKFIWLSENKDAHAGGEYEKIKNVKFINNSKSAKGVAQKLEYMYTVSTARALVYSNQLLGVWGKGRLSLWLEHGMPLKSSNGTYCIKNNCTAAVCEAEYFARYFSNESRLETDKLLFLGFPRNDELFSDSSAAEKFGFDRYEKVIFWLPTFRQRSEASKVRRVGDYEMEAHGTGIPSIETADELIKVNEFLKSRNMLLVLKPHPVQDMSAAVKESLSNFLIINDAALAEKGVRLYQLLGKTDALITDYSSVYYDYLLCDKPIGLTIGDIDEYTKKRGFVYENPRSVLKGAVIETTDELLEFLGSVARGEDGHAAERRRVRDMIHGSLKGSAAERVGDYIINFLNNH